MSFYSPFTWTHHYYNKYNLFGLGFQRQRVKQHKKFGQAELTGCPFMSSVEKHWLAVTPPCQSQKAFDVNTCYVVLIKINTDKPKNLSQ